MEVVGGSAAVVVLVPETDPKAAVRSVGAFFGPQALERAVGTLNTAWWIDSVSPNGGLVDQDLAGMELASVVHPDDVGRLLRAIRNTVESAEDAVVRVRLRHTTLGWTETRCLFSPLSQDENPTLGLGLGETARNSFPGPDAERITTLEGHLLRFATELHAGGWRHFEPLVNASRLAALDQLSRRQREVVDRLLRGERVSSIAASMYISASTVRNHLSQSFNAFGVHNQSELLALLGSHSRDGQRGEPENRD
jgi:DNA-binding CsgD family transcriptional regulator